MDKKEQMKFKLVDLSRRFKRVRPMPPQEVRELSPLEMYVLIGVARTQKTGSLVRPSDIARQCHTSPSAVSQFLKSLEKRGFIERNRVQGDSRSVRVDLTEKGRKAANSAYEARSRFFDSMIEAVGVAEMEQLLETLQKVCTYMENSEAFETEQGGSPSFHASSSESTVE